MKKLLTGSCDADNIFNLIDPTEFLEVDFEAEVVKALTCLLPGYWCGVFAGSFLFEGERRVADLALVHKALSHWFVIEVELAGHSFEQHVLPQVRCFRYGEPETTCVTSLVRAFSHLSREHAESILRYVPRYVAVVGNLPSESWSSKLSALDVQHLTVSIYHGKNGRTAHEVEGHLTVRTESLGFASYSAIDNSLRIPKGCGLPLGDVQIDDQFGNRAVWTIREVSGILWISKNRGPALLTHGSYVQIIRDFDGQIFLRPSST